jgi:hypothetical protein
VPIAGWIFFGVVVATAVNGLVHFGLYSGIRMEVASRLPAGNFIRECVVRPDAVIDRLLTQIAENPIRWSLRAFVAAYLLGGFLFSILERDKSWFDGLWWAWITLFTVGYGDLSPVRWVMRSLAMLVVILGWASLGTMQSALTGKIAARQTERRLRQVFEADGVYHDNIAQVEADLRNAADALAAIGAGVREREVNQPGGRS